MVTTAFVHIWGKRAGAIVWNEKTGLGSFQYDSQFYLENQDLAPIKMPVANRNQIFSFPENRAVKNEWNTFSGLPGMLADVLPDNYGNQLINAYLAQNGREPNSMNPVEKLCFIGTRGMGALEFEPAGLNSKNQPFKIEVNGLVEMAQKMLSKRSSFSTDLKADEKSAMLDILKIGTSAGGARPKAIIAYNEQTKEVRSGQTIAPKGFSHWLLKMDGVSDAQFGKSLGYGRVEMAYYLMAINCGIDMMPSQLLEENGRAHFMTKRFDRVANDEKLHVQTFCAMQHYDYNLVNSFSYEQLFQTMRLLRLSYPDAAQMYKRMVFNVMAKNCDDHTKNFAFTLAKKGEWKLAPAYDICYAYRPDSQWVSQHALSVNGKRSEIDLDDLLAVAKAMNIKNPLQIIKEVRASVSKWNEFSEKTQVSTELSEIISENLILL
ncbi:MAG: type II toxin-antitoxin system HipA family toxin [Salibacteraceae bacterium]